MQSEFVKEKIKKILNIIGSSGDKKLGKVKNGGFLSGL